MLGLFTAVALQSAKASSLLVASALPLTASLLSQNNLVHPKSHVVGLCGGVVLIVVPWITTGHVRLSQSVT